MKKTLLMSAVTAAMLCTPVLAAEPEFNAVGDTYEYGHFTVQALALNANSEEFNENTDFSLYSINDYTAEVPWADSYDANGATSDNNTATMYVITTENKAILVDLGNGAAATASHFGEDAENEEVLDALNAEYKDLVMSLAGGRDLEIAITHNHGDHIGYFPALAGEGLKMYFPAEDYTEQFIENNGDFAEIYDLELFTPGELTLTADDLDIETLLCSGHTAASTIFILDTPVVSYEYNDAGEATDSSAEYMVLSGDAVGSGSSGWIFSLDGLKTLAENIGPVYDKLASYTNYNDYPGEEEKTDATISLLGGHAWQTTNRFGDMNMDLTNIASLKSLLEQIPEGKWVADGFEDKSIEELLQEGYVVTKPLEHPRLDTTIYYGPDLATVAGITTSMEALNEWAAE